MGPRERRSTVLTPVEEAVVIEFRRRTLLSLDDGLGLLRACGLPPQHEPDLRSSPTLAPAIPPDDLRRSLVIARPDDDGSLCHRPRTCCPGHLRKG